MKNILEIKDVSYVYSKGTPFEMVALDNVSVKFEKGKITGLIGHTGSGKSTLVNLLNGFAAGVIDVFLVFLHTGDVFIQCNKLFLS